ncbi:MAG TPA: hypothetical protein VIQ31_10840 [Phormidium sp.]
MNDSDKVVNTLVDAALVFATFAAFSFGPVTAGAVATVGTILQKCMGASQQNVCTNISTLVKEEIQDNEIANYSAVLDTYAQWYNKYYVLAWQGNFKTQIPSNLKDFDSESPFGKFYNYLAEAVSNPSAPLLQTMNKLQIDDKVTSGVNYRVRAFSAFLTGAGIHLTLYNLYLNIRRASSLNESDEDKTDTLVAIATINSYVSYANSVVAYINEQIQNRLNQVSAVQEGDELISVRSPDAIPEDYRGLLFTDSAAVSRVKEFGNELASLPPDTVDFIPHNSSGFFWWKTYTPNTEQANQDRAKYIDQLTQQQQQQYYYTQSDKIAEIIKQWQQSATNLEVVLS